MNYILTEEEYNRLKEAEENYNILKKAIPDIQKNTSKVRNEEIIQRAVGALEKLVSNSDGSFKPVSKEWLWKPISGKVYFNTNHILYIFRQQLKRAFNE